MMTAEDHAQPQGRKESAIIKEEPSDENQYSSLLVPDDNDDEYTPPDSFAQPNPTYSLPGLGIGAGLAFRPSANPTLGTLGSWSHAPPTSLSTVEIAKLYATLNPAQMSSATPQETPQQATGATEQQSESIFESQHHGFLDSAVEQPRKGTMDGERYPTACFDGKMLDLPHHHVLHCRHMVKTPGIESYGGNCMQSKVFDGKPVGLEIQCPFERCRKWSKSRNALFLPTRATRRGKPPAQPRKAVADHIYGVNGDADKKRKEEEREEGLRRGRDMPPPQRRLRQRSASPPNVKTRLYREREALGRGESDAAHSQGAEKPKEIRNLAIAGTPLLGFEHGTQAFHTSRIPRTKLMPNMLLSFEEDDVAIEQENPEYDMPDDDRRNDGSFEMAETHCVCECQADNTLLPCDTCGKHFHPSCVGKGQYTKDSGMYEGDFREDSLFSDVDFFREDKEVFTCLDCDQKAQLISQQPRTDGISEQGSGIILNLRKRGTEKVLADERELARTTQGQLRNEELFGDKEDMNDATDVFHPGIDQVKLRKLQPTSTKSTATYRKPQTRQTSLAQVQQGSHPPSLAPPSNGDVEMGGMNEKSVQDRDQRRSQALSKRRLRPRQGVDNKKPSLEAMLMP